MRAHVEVTHAPWRTPFRLRMKDVMTAQPVTIGREQTLATAHAIMRHNGIRHLPVLEHNELVGIVTQRDLYLMESLDDVDKSLDRVDDAMSGDAYAVSPDAPLADVCAHMAARRIGCAIVVERDRVVGIFTGTDALRILARKV